MKDNHNIRPNIPWGQEGPSRGLRVSGPWMLDLWLRSFADADNCRDFCEHWPELCKPTLITSFLPVPDKRSDTPDNFVGEAETHSGSLVISLSYRKRQRADRLPRRKLSKEEGGEKGRQIFLPDTPPVMLSIFASSLNPILDFFILNFFWIISRLIVTRNFNEVILYNFIFSEVRNFAFFLAHLHNGWAAIFDQACTMRSGTSWNFEIIFWHAVKTTIERIVGKKLSMNHFEEVALWYASFALRGWRSTRYQSACHRDKERQRCLGFVGFSIVSLVYSRWFPARAKIQASYVAFRLSSSSDWWSFRVPLV